MALGRRGLDASALRCLVEAHYDDVFAYCRRHTDSMDEAQDATQEVFLRFVRAAERYRDAGKPLAYLLTIARNVCVDAGRARSRMCDELPCDDVLVSSPDDADAQGSLHGLRCALGDLPSEVRELLELRYDQGLTFAEIARVVGMSRFAVRRRINAALNLLRQSLEQEGRKEHESYT